MWGGAAGWTCLEMLLETDVVLNAETLASANVLIKARM